MFAAIATMALMAAPALVAATGKAVVINSCSYDVFLANTPSSDGVHTAESKTLHTGGTYEQTWVELANLAGWSIKLSLSPTQWSTNIMQYEYTYQNDGIIWYDLSEVDGNPWNGNWEITAHSDSSVCAPKQQAYRYATDDAYGMQACADDAVITVTLCSGNSNAAAGSSAASSAAPVSSAVAASSPASLSPIQTTTFATSTVATVSAVTTNSVGSATTKAVTSTITSVVTSTHYRHSHHARATRRALA